MFHIVYTTHILAAANKKAISHTNSYRTDSCHHRNTGICICKFRRWIWAATCRWYSNRV